MQQRYASIRRETLHRCKGLQPEDYTVQAAEFASPPKWHLGHTTWFFETFILLPHVTGYRCFDPSFDFIFNSYYESVGTRLKRNLRGLLFRPSLQQVLDYRSYVDEAMMALLSSEITPQQRALIELGLQHEQQHQELLVTDTLYLFSQHPFHPVWDAGRPLQAFPKYGEVNWLPVKEDVYTIGYNGNGFCFDNELGRHKQFIPASEIMDRPVTNGEFIEFIEAGGYTDFHNWLSEGWDWVQQNEIRHPLYWKRENNIGHTFHLDGLQPVDTTLPVMHISYYEADAYARWKGAYLPTEFEWETAAGAWPGQFNTPVWEWTRSAYLPYPDFKTPAGAVGEYNGKFMVNQMVLRGKSFYTPAGHSRRSYRNFFHPQLQWQFSGLRLIRYV